MICRPFGLFPHHNPDLTTHFPNPDSRTSALILYLLWRLYCLIYVANTQLNNPVICCGAYNMSLAPTLNHPPISFVPDDSDALPPMMTSLPYCHPSNTNMGEEARTARAGWHAVDQADWNRVTSK